MHTVTVHSTHRTRVTVTLTCSGVTRAQDVDANGTAALRVPDADCTVNCSGVGAPSCPARLGVGGDSFTIQ